MNLLKKKKEKRKKEILIMKNIKHDQLDQKLSSSRSS